ncbi:MAG: 2-oxoglutarate dehydrogenase E1 component, partial [Thiohalomonadales bacterium]
IKAHATVKLLYSERLSNEGVIDKASIEAISKAYRKNLDEGTCVGKDIMLENFEKPFWVNWEPYLNADVNEHIETTIKLAHIQSIMKKLCAVPKGLVIHKQVERILKSRLQMMQGEVQLDWGFAEILAYASLLLQGYSVRLSGQDSSRGTFFHRHAISHDQEDGSYHTPLKHLSADQAEFNVFDSILSEEAVLAYEYGYSTAAPYSLVIWEAQFGDFANGAQVVIDQFISSGQSKWARLSGLVMLLPHGYDGQGPEHSSARLERYLQLCAEGNLQVCVPSVPSQIFHLMRRQVMRKIRVPLVVMSPKSLLRHRLSTSTLDDLSQTSFRAVINEIDDLPKDGIEKILLCCGKVYFDVLDARRERRIENIAIIRVEQLYPFPKNELLQQIKQYPNVKNIVWVQEEPVNQGAWQFLYFQLLKLLPDDYDFSVVARPEAASPAVGYYQKHIEQLHALINEALMS